MEESYDVYAIVRAGGRQEKVAVGDVLLIDKVDNGEAGATLTRTMPFVEVLASLAAKQAALSTSEFARLLLLKTAGVRPDARLLDRLVAATPLVYATLATYPKLADALARTDIADHALAVLRDSKVAEVVIAACRAAGPPPH